MRRARGERSSSAAFSKKTSSPPLKSRVRSAALVTRRRKVWPSASDCSAVSRSDGRNRRLVLIFEWLTLCPTIGPTPVSSQRRDMATDLPAKERRRAEARAPAREQGLYAGPRAGVKAERRPE